MRGRHGTFLCRHTDAPFHYANDPFLHQSLGQQSRGRSPLIRPTAGKDTGTIPCRAISEGGCPISRSLSSRVGNDSENCVARLRSQSKRIRHRLEKQAIHHSATSETASSPVPCDSPCLSPFLQPILSHSFAHINRPIKDTGTPPLPLIPPSQPHRPHPPRSLVPSYPLSPSITLHHFFQTPDKRIFVPDTRCRTIAQCSRRVRIIGIAAVLKTAGRKPVGVRVPHPPHSAVVADPHGSATAASIMVTILSFQSRWRSSGCHVRIRYCCSSFSSSAAALRQGGSLSGSI